ncbi:MAG: hypothetical protein ACP5UF_01225 [Hydrogenobaculum sp.]
MVLLFVPGVINISIVSAQAAKPPKEGAFTTNLDTSFGVWFS